MRKKCTKTSGVNLDGVWVDEFCVRMVEPKNVYMRRLWLTLMNSLWQSSTNGVTACTREKITEVKNQIKRPSRI